MSRERFEPMTFTTEHAGTTQIWTYDGPKKGGANSAGEHGGFYVSNGQKCLIKQDVRYHLNIAEFLAGKIYQATIPSVSAKIKLVRVDESKPVSSDGSNVYLLSEFIPGWKHDLYTDIQTSVGRSTEHSNYKLLEFLEVRGQLIFRSQELKKFFQEETQKGNLTNFGQVSAVSLLINNIDTNLGNLGVIEADGRPKKIGVIDYGAAFRDMTPEINPHSYKKYFLSHTINHEGGNNFMFYPESIKITPEFVDELDKAAAANLEPIIEDAFNEISAYFGIKPIMAFAVRAGLSEKYSDTMLDDLERNPQLCNQAISQIKDKLKKSIKDRQVDLSRFSAQIKMDMCVQFEEGVQQYTLNGEFSQNGKKMRFTDVVFSHFEYFKEIALGEKEFKFRKSKHKQQSELTDTLEAKCNEIFASFILAPQNQQLQNQFNIRSVEQAISALENGRLDREKLRKALDVSFSQEAQNIFNTYQDGKKQKKFDLVKQILNGAQIVCADTTEATLRQNIKLQDAIIELNTRCAKLSINYNQKEQQFIDTYKKETLKLALAGESEFKNKYPAVEATAIAGIDNSNFTKLARAIGNLIWVSLATVSVVGLFALYYKSNNSGVLLFQSPQRDISAIASRFSDIKPDVEKDRDQIAPR